MAPLTWTLSDLMTPSCGISTVVIQQRQQVRGDAVPLPAHILSGSVSRPHTAGLRRMCDWSLGRIAWVPSSPHACGHRHT